MHYLNPAKLTVLQLTAAEGASLQEVLSGILGAGNDSGVDAKLFAKTILLDNHRTSTKKKAGQIIV